MWNKTNRDVIKMYKKWTMYNGKTEYLGTHHTEDLQVNGNIIPTVKQFKYLGSKV
jgi:hypothetical protein